MRVPMVRLRIGEEAEASSMVVLSVSVAQKGEILLISTVEERRTTR